jgi:DNA anti-recombination protein RmuC
MADSRYEDLDRRVRELANEVEGEKLVTRHVLDQCRRNGAEIAAVRVDLATIGLRIDNLAGDVTQARAALNRLNIIGQDVTLLRNEGAALRQDMQQGLTAVREEMQQGLAAVRQEMQQGLAAVREEMQQGLAAVREEMQQGLARVREEMQQGLAGLRDELLSAIRALAGRSPSA